MTFKVKPPPWDSILPGSCAFSKWEGNILWRVTTEDAIIFLAQCLLMRPSLPLQELFSETASSLEEATGKLAKFREDLHTPALEPVEDGELVEALEDFVNCGRYDPKMGGNHVFAGFNYNDLRRAFHKAEAALARHKGKGGGE